MKILKRLGIWIFISIVIQFGIFFYLDNFYFTAEGKVKTESVVLKKPTQKDINVALPKGVDLSNIKLSNDGKYFSYLLDNSIKIVNLATGETRSVNYDATVKALFFKWLPDRDRMIIAEQHLKNNSPIIKFFSCEVKSTENVKDEIRDNRDNEVYITLKDPKSTVDDIQLSTQTNMIYVKIARPGSRNNVYSINVMGQMVSVNTNYMIGKMSVMVNEDRLVYEDITNHKIYVADSNSISLPKVDLKLISIIPGDKGDVVYLGKYESYKITQIYYGSITETIDKWKTIVLKTPLDINSILISSKGKVYLNDSLRGTITEQASGKKTTYKGLLLQMLDDCVLSYAPDSLKISKTDYK